MNIALETLAYTINHVGWQSPLNCNIALQMQVQKLDFLDFHGNESPWQQKHYRHSEKPLNVLFPLNNWSVWLIF